MTNSTIPKFTLYVDNLSIMSSSGLFHSMLPLVATAVTHYSDHQWYIKNNWNGKIVRSNYMEEET